jgi:hypothetical protein
MHRDNDATWEKYKPDQVINIMYPYRQKWCCTTTNRTLMKTGVRAMQAPQEMLAMPRDKKKRGECNGQNQSMPSSPLK